MTRAIALPAIAASAAVSALQRRLMIAESLPDEDWLNLAENVPEWPIGTAPRAPASSTGAEAYGYAQSQGVPELIEALVEREALVSASSLIQAKNIAISSGGMHALGLVFRECVARGYRKAIYAIPTFIGVHSTMVAAGLSICPLPLSASEADWDLLSAVCHEPTVIYLNLPHNPTGRTATPAYLAMIAAFAATHNVMVVYDAVYDAFRFCADSAPAPIDWAVTIPTLIVVNSVSKNFGRPGDRIGWIVAHEEVIKSLVPRIEWEIVCVNPRAQLSAASVIRQGNGPLVQAVRAGREAFMRRAAGHPILDIALPAGGTQLWLDLGVEDIEAFADYALMTQHLILTTSSNYAPALPGYLRLPTGIPAERIERGVEILCRALSEWGSRRPKRPARRRRSTALAVDLARRPLAAATAPSSSGIACIAAALSPIWGAVSAEQAPALPTQLDLRASEWLATLPQAPTDLVVDPAIAARVTGRLAVDPDASVGDLLAAGSGLVPWTVAPGRDAAAAGGPLAPGVAAALLERTSSARGESTRAPRLILELFAEQAVTHGDRCAIDAADGTVTFAELERRTSALAHQLLERGVEPGSVVAVVAPRETVLIEALIAIWRAGAAFLLVDPHDPYDLSLYKLEAASARLVVCDEAFASAWQGVKLPVIAPDPTASAEGGAGRPLPDVAGQRLAYIVFTSGSTGQPKGVMIDHAGLAEHLATQLAPPYDAVAVPGSALRVGGAAPVSFDSFIDQVLPMIALGHTLVLFSEEERVTPARFLASDASAVDVVDCASSQLTVLVEHGLLERERPLRLIVFGGENPSQHTWERVRASGVPAISIYGATECTIGSMAADVHGSEVVTLGFPDGSARIYLLDDAGHAVPPGMLGEIYLAGPGVGPGYVGAPHETAQRFVPDPFSRHAGARMYRTGDLGRMDSCGRLYFCGRRDDQVKIRGFRIELGQVEAALMASDGVRQAAVLPVPADGVATHLAAYLVGAPNLDWPAIRAHIARHLPAHMLPARALQLEALPLTRNGKVDRRALAALDAAGAPAEREEAAPAVPPANQLETWLRDIWQAVLKQDQIGVLDNLAAIGGHSLATMEILARIQQDFPHPFDVRAALAAQSVREMAAVLTQAIHAQGEAHPC